MGRVLGTTGNEDSTIVCLDRTEANRDVEVDGQNFPLFALIIDVVEGDDLLVELEEVDLIRLRNLELLLLLLVHHFDAGDREVVSHGQLRVAIETYVLLGCLRIVFESPAAATAIGVLRATVAAGIRTAAEALDLWGCAGIFASAELEKQLVYLDVAVVHDKIFGQEVLQCIAFDDFHL